MQWLMFQMSGIGPMQGQANVFYQYLDEKIPIAISRYQNECRRLYEVLDGQLNGRKWICDDYSIADITKLVLGKSVLLGGDQYRRIEKFKKWMHSMEKRPACIRGSDIPKRDTSKKLVSSAKKIIQT